MSAWSLRARMLMFVVAAVVVPLTAVGVWLARSTERAAGQLVSSQLDSILAQAQDRVADQWRNAASDVRLLGSNEPVIEAMRGADTAAAVPQYVSEALATMPALTSVVFRRPDGSVRWRVSEESDGPYPGANRRAPLILRSPIGLGGDSATFGSVEARVAEAVLLPSEAPHAPAQALVVLRDRNEESPTAAVPMPPELLARDRFDWNGQQWITARHSLADPPVEIIAAAPVDPVARPFARAALAGIAALAVVAAVVVLLTAVGARRLTASLGDLATAADAVAQGDFGLALTVEGPSDVRRLSRAFNTMRDNVRTMMSERSQRESLAALGELAATVAHQIRTPLTAIRLDLQRVEEMVDGEAADLVSHALSGADRIEGAVNASLVMARAGTPRFEPVAVAALVAEAAANTAPRAAARRVALVLPRDDDALMVRGDRGALVQMLTNILINGAEAARGEVRVAVSNGDRIAIEVADDGPGIPAADLPRVGEPFYSTKVGGTGLGLTIARRVLDAHRGRLSVSSGEQGTTVRVELPV